MEKPQVYWPYNKTFRYYHDFPLAGKRAQDFVDKRNQCKGGQWILVPSAEYHKWYKAVGQHQDYLKELRKNDPYYFEKRDLNLRDYLKPSNLGKDHGPMNFDTGYFYSPYIPTRL
jgi:hypothetical protein